ncbi:hypothetical protein FGG08_004551 [Glutinoglossum americanum]|uniref:Uncharacterized protein n=1 Tax=Glutinoglossum americanum TaxID=1670608 RepID=A0A9P8I5H6_9PEZI|nr:hypothetical protein FGG08_004551 [Glutinoglossum americanum]
MLPPQGHRLINSPLPPYRRRIKSRLLQSPGLATLDLFMSKGAESPLFLERMHKFNIDVIHILRSGEVCAPIRCRTKDKFDTAISSEVPPNRISTFILAKDLSHIMIETLGTRFNLAPEYFALHLRGIQPFQTGEWRPLMFPELDLLPSYYLKAPFYSVEIYRSYYFPGGLPEIIELRRSETNLPRGAYVAEGLENGAVQERASVYQTKLGDIDFGIILTDRLLKEERPIAGVDTILHFEDQDPDKNLSPTPSNQRDQPTYKNKQLSCRKEVVGWLQKLSVTESAALFHQAEPLAVCPLVRVSAAQSSLFLFEARNNLNRIFNKQHDHKFPDDPKFCLHITRRLHKHLYIYRQHLEQNIQVIAAKSVDGTNEPAITQDIVFLRQEMDSLLRRVEEDVKFLAFNMSIHQAELVNYLTKIAILFIPVSTIAAVFAIPGPGLRFAIFGAVTGSVIAILCFCMFVWNPVHWQKVVKLKLKKMK